MLLARGHFGGTMSTKITFFPISANFCPSLNPVNPAPPVTRWTSSAKSSADIGLVPLWYVLHWTLMEAMRDVLSSSSSSSGTKRTKKIQKKSNWNWGIFLRFEWRFFRYNYPKSKYHFWYCLQKEKGEGSLFLFK